MQTHITIQKPDLALLRKQYNWVCGQDEDSPNEMREGLANLLEHMLEVLEDE